MRYARLAGFALNVGLLGASESAELGPSSLIDLGAGTRAYGINATGQVTGCIPMGADATHAFLYTGGTLTDLGTLGGTSSCGLALNASGQITGYADTAVDRHAFLYANGVMEDLTALSGMPTTAGRAINTSGDIVGDPPQFGGATVAIRYSHGVVTNLFPLNVGYTGSTALAVNDAGVISGDVFSLCGTLCPIETPYVIANGVTTELPLPAGNDGNLFYVLIAGINAAGEIAAYGEDPAGFYHGVLYLNGTPIDLGNNTTAYAINSNGDVVGNSNVRRLGLGNADVGVFLYRAGITRDLNLPGLYPTGINDSGWIIGIHPTLNHSYTLQPSRISLLPIALSFGNVGIGRTSSATASCGACSATLTNGTSSAIAVTGVAVTGPFVQSNDCDGSLSPAASCAISVTFKPSAPDTALGSLTVSTAGAQYTTLLSGVGAVSVQLSSSTATATINVPFTLTWTATSGSTCTASASGNDSQWNGAVASSGSKAIMESMAGRFTFSLACAQGSQSEQAQVVVVLAAKPAGSGGGALDIPSIGALLTLLGLRTPRRHRNLQIFWTRRKSDSPPCDPRSEGQENPR